MSLDGIGEFLASNAVPVAVAVLLFLSAGIGLLRTQQRKVANQTVAAVYRRALEIAVGVQRERLAWLLSEEGVRKRKQLVGEAYDQLPAVVVFGKIALPIGAAKLFISREQFIVAVEAAFEEVVQLADRLDGADDV